MQEDQKVDEQQNLEESAKFVRAALFLKQAEVKIGIPLLNTGSSPQRIEVDSTRRPKRPRRARTPDQPDYPQQPAPGRPSEPTSPRQNGSSHPSLQCLPPSPPQRHRTGIPPLAQPGPHRPGLQNPRPLLHLSPCSRHRNFCSPQKSRSRRARTNYRVRRICQGHGFIPDQSHLRPHPHQRKRRMDQPSHPAHRDRPARECSR